MPKRPKSWIDTLKRRAAALSATETEALRLRCESGAIAGRSALALRIALLNTDLARPPVAQTPSAAPPPPEPVPIAPEPPEPPAPETPAAAQPAKAKEKGQLRGNFAGRCGKPAFRIWRSTCHHRRFAPSRHACARPPTKFRPGTDKFGRIPLKRWRWPDLGLGLAIIR